MFRPAASRYATSSGQAGRRRAFGTIALLIIAVAIGGCDRASDRDDAPAPTKTSTATDSPTLKPDAPSPVSAAVDATQAAVSPKAPDAPSAKAETLATAANELDKTLWANEVLAQRHESRFIRLWDEMRASGDPFDIIARFPLERMIVGRRVSADTLEWNIRRSTYGPSDPPREVDAATWRSWLAAFRQGGFHIVQSEWHHSAFTPPAADRPAHSEVSMEIHLANTDKQHTLLLKGTLGIEWAASKSDRDEPTPRVIDASRITLFERQGPLPFRPAVKIEPQPARGEDAVEVAPLIVHDLDDDGLPEILLGGCNTLLRNRGAFQFERVDLFEQPVALRNTGVVADFTGDGRADLFGVDRDGIIRLAVGQTGPRPFAEPAVCFDAKLDGPSAVTAGDVDADGDLDLWLTQYRAPYIGGQMPTPFYDALDGFPSYLLINDGSGRFADATEKSGLAAKRQRRTYSASFVDLDDDGDLDLLVVSDFSGLDVHENDGRGRFSEVTSKYVDERHGFGMSHAFGDFDRDGKLDLYFVGMSSTTARRLERLGLKRSDMPHVDAKRMDMAYGNRLYQRRGPRFEQTNLNAGVARAGWAWGCSATDFDNDGDDELYVANGHISGKSSRDYCTRYWCHDVYAGSSQPDPEVARFLTDMFRPTEMRGLETGEISWNGYEHKKLFLNLGGREFVDVAPLVGVAYEFDARGVVTADLDADGRNDLLVVTNRWASPLQRVLPRQSLYVLRNELDGGQHWLGVRLESHDPKVSTIGARVTLRGPNGARERRTMTGDSYYAQHPAVAHFGLGDDAKVDEIEVRWPNGSISRIPAPAIDRYHVVRPGK